MFPGPPRRWDAAKEQELEEHGPSAGSDPEEASTSGEEALGEPGAPPQDRLPAPGTLGPAWEVPEGGCDRCTSVPPAPSPQPWSRRPSWSRREQLLPRPPPGLAAEHSPGTPVALSPQMAWEVAPSRMTVLAPWDPNYKAKAGPQQVWAGLCVIPHCGRCTRQPQAGTSGPWPLQQDIRMESMCPGMQILCCHVGSVFPCTSRRPLSR
ncbi:histone deacetylase complex subunit SAP25 isoform X7 [Hyaena hyaena]|uniref:histone deacetylase complex subunit SAP25 isoform X7 n=1 Tax=Hyaena hyaena TaxID=95912 RepID=UPI001920CF22|nr:histone deacetylase complex subunit SAP25 isoform X7 [Hyaena hyaena]